MQECTLTRRRTGAIPGLSSAAALIPLLEAALGTQHLAYNTRDLQVGDGELQVRAEASGRLQPTVESKHTPPPSPPSWSPTPSAPASTWTRSGPRSCSPPHSAPPPYTCQRGTGRSCLVPRQAVTPSPPELLPSLLCAPPLRRTACRRTSQSTQTPSCTHRRVRRRAHGTQSFSSPAPNPS